MSEKEPEEKETEDKALKIFNPIHDLQHCIRVLEAAAKTPPPRPMTYHYDPALAKKLATLTLKVKELERRSLLCTLQSPNPPAPPPARPSCPPGLPRPLPLPAAWPKQTWAKVACKEASKPSTINTPVMPPKHDRTLIIIRNGTLIPTGTTPII